MQKARRHALRFPAIALRPLVGTWFQVHIPPLTGVLLIFRSLYLFTIGRQGVFSLTGWSPLIQSRFHVTRPTQGTLQRQSAFAYGTVTLYGRPFQIILLANCLITPVEGPTTPRWKPPRFGLFPFRSPLLRTSIFLSFPADTEMFQFSAFATRALCIQTRSVQESRDHHLFDGSPGLIAVFRALQSLLTPRHPPCALCSLTTRIECSRSDWNFRTRHFGDIKSEFKLRPESSPASAPAPFRTVTLTLSFCSVTDRTRTCVNYV